MSALKYQKATFHFIFLLLFLNINSKSTLLNAQDQKLSAYYDQIRNVKFTGNNKIFFSTKDNRKFGYIDQLQGQLSQITQLQDHQTIINQNSKTLVIRSQSKHLKFFDIKSGNEIIDESVSNLEKQDFTQVISFAETKLGKYILTQKDLRFLEIKKQHHHKQYRKHEHLSSEQQHQKTKKQVNQKQLTEHQEDHQNQKNFQKYEIIYQINTQEEKDTSIQYFYDLIAFPSKQISSRVVLIVLMQTASKKLLCFKQFRGWELFDGKCHHMNSLNLVGIQTSGEYLYIQMNKQKKSKSKIVSNQAMKKKQLDLNIQYQLNKQQIKGLLNKINSQEASTIVFNSNLQPINIFNKEIQQFHKGCAIFSNHQTYIPQYQSQFQYRIIDDGQQQGNIRAIVGNQAIFISDYRSISSFYPQKDIENKQKNCQDQQTENIQSIELKLKNNSFLTKIKRKAKNKYLQPISMYIFTQHYKSHYFFLVQFIDNTISFYEFSQQKNKSNDKFHQKRGKNKDKNDITFDLKYKQLWSIQSIKLQVSEKTQQSTDNTTRFKKKNASSIHSQQMFGQSGQYL